MTPQTRILGSTGFNASMLGIGDLADRAVPMERCVATIHRAMDSGLNLIDTAPGYEDGHSEAIVGAALRGRREGMFVIDKIDDLDKPADPQVDASLKALGFPNEQDEAFAALAGFRPLAAGRLENIRRQAIQAMEGKGLCWWNPAS